LYSFHPEAELEFAKAILHYIETNPGLAEDFISEIEHGIRTIQRSPLLWRLVDGDVRRYLTHRFPYGLYYTVNNDVIVIWAVMHLSREAGYWKKRRL
jgi:plasmid stabilization system protein ParE